MRLEFALRLDDGNFDHKERIDWNRSACVRCSNNQAIGGRFVQCAVSGAENFLSGRCRLRKWIIQSERKPFAGVWILSYPRTGSNYLASMLNGLGLSPPIKEWYHPTFWGQSERVPPNNKVHPPQVRQSGVELEEVALARPELRYIRLRRRDLIACAVSLYLAKKTDIWRITSLTQAHALQARSPVMIDSKDLMLAYDNCLRFDAYWGDQIKCIGIKVQEVFYEDLVSSPAIQMMNILNFIQVNHDPSVCIAQASEIKQSLYQDEYMDCYMNIKNRIP